MGKKGGASIHIRVYDKDPLSPYLFVLLMEKFVNLTQKEVEDDNSAAVSFKEKWDSHISFVLC